MCQHHHDKKKKALNPHLIWLFAVIAGVLCAHSPWEPFVQFGVLISDIFVRIFKCLSLPVICLSILTTLIEQNDKAQMRPIWRKMILYTLGTTLVAASLACGLYLLIQPESLQTKVPSQIPPVAEAKSGYLQYLVKIIPDNFISPFLENQVMAILFLSLVVGLAYRAMAESELKSSFKKGVLALHQLVFIVTGWVVRMMPLGLFGFVTASALQFKGGAQFKGLGAYLSIVLLANFIQGFAVLPLWLKSHGFNPFATMKSMLPALSVAFFTKSSAGTLPITMEVAEKNLKVDPTISRFVLPLCTTINMNGCAAFILTTVVYVQQNHGVTIDFQTLFTWTLLSTIAAIGNAGVPMGCFFLSASLLASMNIPLEILGLILPFYAVIDMVETALNVWSDSCVAVVLNKNFKQS